MKEKTKSAPVKHQILELLPLVLPRSATEALTGTQIIEKLRTAGLKGSTDKSLRSWLSGFASNPKYSIARVANGHGYFFRTSESETSAPKDGEVIRTPSSSSRDVQLEEKFRALFMKWCESQGQFPVLLNHNEGAKKSAGLNRWKYPDVISLLWDVLHEESEEEFDENALDVMRGLGEPPFQLISTELKVELRPSTLREAFFQCVSNSRWAHTAQLVVATSISDDSVVAELARLGPSYEVTVLSFGLTPEGLKGLPSADKIRNMSENEVDQLLQKVSVSVIATGETGDQLDWDQLRDLQKQHDAVDDILEWIARSLHDKRPYSFDKWASTLKKKTRR